MLQDVAMSQARASIADALWRPFRRMHDVAILPLGYAADGAPDEELPFKVVVTADAAFACVDELVLLFHAFNLCTMWGGNSFALRL